MLKKIPIAAPSIDFTDIAKSFFNTDPGQENFKKALLEFFSSDCLFLCSSGTAAFYLILKALKEISDKKEVILPAYVASVLILPIQKLGLKPVLCDISLDDFNLDINLLTSCVSSKTLYIVYAYMFGIISQNIINLKQTFSDTFVAEDCAQAMGSKIKGVSVGKFGDVSFFSFNRGKNLTTYGGGCISANNKELAKLIEKEIKNLKEENLFLKLLMPLKLLTLSLVIKPYLYGLLYPLIARVKDSTPYEDFKIKKYTNFQANIGFSILRRIEEFSRIRYNNGMKLIEGLKGIEYIILPKIATNAKPAFNRLPIVVRDLEKREKIEMNLWRSGIETSRMYLKPLHHIFELGYKKKEFPNAVYLSERLLTLPVHPLVSEDTIDKIISIFKNL